MDLSVDLAQESVQYTTGDVLVMYTVIIIVAIAVAVIMFKWANRKNSSNKKRHN